MNDSHCFPLGSLTPQKIRSGGTRSDATVKNFPVLKGLALSLLTLNPKGVREPHWHPNANELSYCLEGTGMMTIFGPGNNHDTFTIRAGEIVFVPQGYIHHIENTGSAPLRLAICFDHEAPEDLDFSAGVSAMPAHILAETCGVGHDCFANLPNEHAGVFISERNAPAIPPLPFIVNRYKMDIDGENPQVKTKGGTVKMSNHFLLPTLQGLAVYSLILNKNGAREPHWHPNAGELNFLVRGSARITLLSPNGQAETFDMKAGDASFMPKGYLHHIENTGLEEAFFTVFFNHTAPTDIGFSGCFGAYSNDVLASLFGVPPQYFKTLTKSQQDLFVVGGA